LIRFLTLILFCLSGQREEGLWVDPVQG